VCHDLFDLKQKVKNYHEPEAYKILESKIKKEKEYISEEIIQMEIKQIAKALIELPMLRK
jgi:hypothetical protein